MKNALAEKTFKYLLVSILLTLTFFPLVSQVDNEVLDSASVAIEVEDSSSYASLGFHYPSVVYHNSVRNPINTADTLLVSTTLLSPQESLFDPVFFAVNSGLYQVPVMLNTNDLGWLSHDFMLWYDDVKFTNDTTPKLTAKYDHGFNTTHWFTAGFDRKIGKSTITAHYNRSANEALYVNTATNKSNFKFGVELPFRKNYKFTLAYYRNTANVSESGGVENLDSLPVVDVFNSTTLSSNLATASNSVFQQKIAVKNNFLLFQKRDSLNNQSQKSLRLNIDGHIEQQRMTFAMQQRDIDSAFFQNTFLDSTETFDSIGFQAIAIKPYLDFESKRLHAKAGAFKSFNDFSVFNDAYAFADVNFKIRKLGALKVSGEYHFESFREGSGFARLDYCTSFFKTDSNTIQDVGSLNISLEAGARAPEFLFLNFKGNHFNWSNDFALIQYQKLGAVYNLPNVKTIVSGNIQSITNHIYLNQQSLPTQADDVALVGQLQIKNILDNKRIGFYSGITAQFSTVDYIRIPNLVSRNTLVFKFKYRSIPVRVGGTLSYFTKFTGMNYNPNLRHFSLGNTTVGGTPVFDWFFITRLGPAEIYVKYDNSFYLLNRNLFLADNFPIYRPYFRLGLKWNLLN